MNINCKPLLALVLGLLLTGAHAAFAHGSHSCCGHGHDHKPESIKIEEIPLDGLDERQYRQMLDDAHHAIESGGLNSQEPQGRIRRKLRQWRNNFQFTRNFLNAYRWYSSHRGVPYAENAAANIAGMLVTSHALETVGGWTMAAAGVGGGLDSPVEWAMTTIGVSISVPGLDPLCIILVGTYKRWPARMDRALTLPRIFVVRTAKTALGVAGVPEGFLQAVWDEYLKRRFVDQFKASPNLTVRAIMDRDLEFYAYGPRDDQIISLKMQRRADGRQALRSISFSTGVPAMVRTYTSDLLKPFGKNIREFALEMDKFIGAGKFEAMEKLPYVEKVDRLPWRYTIFLKDNAFPFYELNEKELTCETLLKSAVGDRG